VDRPAFWVEPLIRGLALACALFALSSITLAAWNLDSTIDEAFHLDYPRKIIDDQLPDRNGIYNSKTPALLPSAWAERLAIGAGVTAPKSLEIITRLTSALYFLALLVAVFHFARRFAGAQAGWIAVLCCSLEPSLIAHASLNTVDVAFALANLLALWAMVSFARRADWRTALSMGAALGLAFTVKFTGLYLVPAVLSLPFWKQDGQWPAARERARRAGWVALAVLVSMLVISASYYFRGFGQPLAEYPFVTRPFQLLASSLGWLRLPLPQAFLLGVDMSVAYEREAYNVILFDRRFEYGVWYYFAVLWFFKTPIAIMAASIAGLWAGWRSRAFRQPGMGLLFFQWALYCAYFSFFFQAQLGYRFVLMLVPMTCLFLAVGLKDWWTRPKGAYAAIGVAALSLAELMPYHGHTLAFSNSFLLPKKDAYRVLADSNLYWNEYYSQIPLLLLEHGMQAPINPVHILPGKNAFDSLELSGVFSKELQHRWVRENLQTSSHVKHGIFVYDVSERDFSRFLDENRRYPPSGAAARCEGAGHASMQIVAQSEGSMLLCANAAALSDVSLNLWSGTAKVGHADRDGRCLGNALAAGHELWFRLEPGRHLLCLSTSGKLAGRWDVRRGTASFRLTVP
jgi:hypothetical protein